MRRTKGLENQIFQILFNFFQYFKYCPSCILYSTLNIPVLFSILRFLFFQVIEKFIRFAYRQRYNGQNMTYEASTFLYAIAVAVFALGGMCGGFVGGWVANKLGRFDFLFC